MPMLLKDIKDHCKNAFCNQLDHPKPGFRGTLKGYLSTTLQLSNKQVNWSDNNIILWKKSSSRSVWRFLFRLKDKYHRALF